ncbi:U11/U12 small nuclear ribonucleoprotein 48 kDa protein-like isoform X2 [Belonocnema kinseyi]|uniref:U11/U12 small nuclear ribonucleoprotein 48 kDa protein-like isoform X2 n=1 Tax=Belonocnema kinseyi TaxID=2817044 RepID=UPI00143DB4EB|nr:U11/U12 small nuclear ribonucleoprotein 48 kDa protein-like isoform X2 [Belonocnema kinseyi]
MSDILSENRKQQLDELESFIQTTDTELENILSNLGWNLENLDTNAENEVVCPFNPGHRLPEKSLEQHLINCQWRAEGYDKFDVALSESTLPSVAPSTIKMDEDLQTEILLAAKKKEPNMISGIGERLIPRTSDRIFIDFTGDERKAIYDYVVANTQKVDIGHDIADLNQTKSKESQKSISYLELLAQERNLKRRRAKHRGVHTNKKSHVEVMREVIEQQMEMFKEYLVEQNPQDERKEEPFPEIISRVDFSKNLRIPELPFERKFENRKYSSERDGNSFQRFERNGRHDQRENRREHHSHQSDRKDYHNKSHKRDRHRSSEERPKKYKKRDCSRDKDTSREKKRKRSKDRHRNRSREYRESRHNRDRKRSGSKNRR